ncbi:hypothetical protein PsorP6_001004 [Peronosclerospora sorghi]|uniref:Uncharacterized protein n=1 Tax=Peronosclerospora sorghi TaxID=230839 RepID=A0ACC0WTR6_9STRA|nr:hypothetical protein PsorP6_001004 [Peronosclerospora sorghi]
MWLSYASTLQQQKNANAVLTSWTGVSTESFHVGFYQPRVEKKRNGHVLLRFCSIEMTRSPDRELIYEN